ncbi:hypothetical protein AAFN60_01885 [Roseibacillus persicicus]|uniref:hypothetical protein n=1 Tax=Roseibacillus persicicus TaxID=454148 RepID=UPI00398AA98F
MSVKVAPLIDQVIGKPVEVSFSTTRFRLHVNGTLERQVGLPDCYQVVTSDAKGGALFFAKQVCRITKAKSASKWLVVLSC